jgi:hypothetical protein
VNTQKNACRTIWIGGNANAGGFQQEVADVYTHHDRAQANAALIAAAPDMLEALKEIYCAVVWNSEIDGPEIVLRLDAIKAIRRVITKAEGNES